MKSLSFRCIWFALVIAGCGDSNKGKSSLTVEHTPLVAPKDIVKPGFGEQPVDPMVTPKGMPKAVEPIVVEQWIPETAAECMKLGKELVAKNDHKAARALFEAAAKKNRKSADPHIELARSYITTGDKGPAIKAANKGVKLAPESSHAHNTLGRAELLRHDYEGAITAFRQATELNADNVWAWNNLGLVHLTLKNYPEAINALVEATTRKGTEGYMWNNLGTAYEQLDQLDDAREAFEAGAKLGSAAAKASRKRLEGVDTIVVKNTKPDPDTEHTYEDREEMPEIPDDIEGGDDVEDVVVDETEHGDSIAEEPIAEEKPEVKPEVKIDEAKPEAKPEPKPEDKPESQPEAPKPPVAL